MVEEQRKDPIMTDEQAEQNEEVTNEQSNQSEETIIDLEEHQKDETESENSKLNELEEEKNEIYERLLRLQAEYDNYKKRTQKEKITERKYKSQELVTELLPALDNFERALKVEVTEATKSMFEGITMVYNQINEALKTEGVEEIETVGEEFDPHLHHAVMQEDDENQPSNTVIEELQKGYKLSDRVIRPAMVKVNK